MHLSRRSFVKGIGGLLAALLLHRSALAQAAGRINRGRILVIYASKCGSTAEVAERIGSVLRGLGAEVDVRSAESVEDLAAYRAVVVGSATRAGSWLGPATRFLQRNRAALAKVPVATFTCCLTLQQDTPENRAKVLAYTADERRAVPPVSQGLFAGKLAYAQLSFIERRLMHLMDSPEGDFRDWAKIEAWARSLAAPLGIG